MPSMLSPVTDWIADRSVLVLGLGREGRSSLGVLAPLLAKGRIGAADKDPAKVMSGEFPSVRFHCGADYLDHINKYDIVIKSPGIRGALLDGYQGEITTQVDLFFLAFRKQCIGITGTKGKSTTASLLHHILKGCGLPSVIAGNIGIPIFDILPSMSKDAIVVCELSAHQLEYTRHVPVLSAWLNLYPEHLDHFRDLAAYRDAKARIGLLQEDGDRVLVSAENEVIRKALSECAGELVLVPSEEVTDQETMLEVLSSGGITNVLPSGFHSPLSGKHNRFNILVAATLARFLGCGQEDTQRQILSFKPLPHRMESIAVIDGVNYVNDSIATVPEATLAALDAFPDTSCLILGGFDRGIDFSTLYSGILSAKLRCLVLLGPAGERMMKELGSQETGDLRILNALDMQDAVDSCVSIIKPGETCLLSPSAASYDVYSGFEERGDAFRSCVLAML